MAACYLQGEKWPGEMFSLVVEMFNEFNQPASGFLKLFIVDSNNQVSDDNIVHDQLM